MYFIGEDNVVREEARFVVFDYLSVLLSIHLFITIIIIVHNVFNRIAKTTNITITMIMIVVNVIISIIVIYIILSLSLLTSSSSSSEREREKRKEEMSKVKCVCMLHRKMSSQKRMRYQENKRETDKQNNPLAEKENVRGKAKDRKRKELES